MSHIPDGTLHAWLDGAAGFESAAEEESFQTHLGVCEDCRARLEEARRLREDAQTILSDSGPDAIDQPAFGELEARAMVRVRRERAGDSDDEVAASVDRVAGRHGAVRRAGEPETTGSGRRPWLTRRVPLAWAASIVMAIGAGWFGNRILQESPLQAPRPVAQSKLADVSDADVSVLEEDSFGDEASREVVRGAAVAAGPEVVGDVKSEDLSVPSERGRRQFAASPEPQERFGYYEEPDPAANQPVPSVDNLAAGQVAGRDAGLLGEASQEGEAFALDSRLEKRSDDVAHAAAGNRAPAEDAPIAIAPTVMARQAPTGGAEVPARDQNEDRDNRIAGLSREAAPPAAEPNAVDEAGAADLRDRLAEASDEDGVAANASKSVVAADAPAESINAAGQRTKAGGAVAVEGAVALDALVIGGEAGFGEGKGDDEDLAHCFALTTGGWTPPFELPSLLVRPADGDGEQEGARVAWTMLADNSVRIRWRSGDQTMLLTARRVSAGALEGSAAVWLESGGALAARGLVRLSPVTCPQP